MMHSLQDHTLPITSGRKLHVVTRQAAEPLTIFFVHGGGGNKNQWREQLAYFSHKAVNLVAWDAFGHGRSQNSKREKDFAAVAFLSDFQTVFEKYKTEKNIIIAHSFGCCITLAWLLQVWQKHHVLPIEGAAFLGPAPHEQSRRGLFNNWMDHLPLPAMELLRPRLARRFEALAWHPNTDADLMAQERLATQGNTLFMMRALLRNGPVFTAQSLHRLPPFPVTLVAGKQDGIVPFSTVENLNAALTGSTLSVLESCGHQIMLEQPKQVNQLIEQLIQRVKTDHP
ncbi:alpha/beta hydrolase [Acetobacter malorum DSM 14337]|uniref:Alpha/beta hydrolase n=1 Tax=Acetobacter malorum DSM 14337 TaxID=1307910 RepID=A0ABQ0PSX7_9PROT|nr:alpha/beta hydrolase [Acetobacter malorum]KXV04968.1 hypothetical protein AD930_15485 [Acetobacter malorum]GBQ80220.1 alpha/beta hydrolase [Acetobacter malorum DSM 14337]